jgi:hypothetical protein
MISVRETYASFAAYMDPVRNVARSLIFFLFERFMLRRSGLVRRE